MRYGLSIEKIVHCFLNENAGKFKIVEVLKGKKHKILAKQRRIFAKLLQMNKEYNKNGKW
jgi:hypothetical protein